MGGDPVVVTGMGLVAPQADSVEELASAMDGPMRPTPSAGGGPLSVPLEPFDPKRYLDRRGLKDLSRLSQMACSAAAPLARRLEGVEPAEVGVALGTAWGSVGSVLSLEDEARRLGTRFVNPLLFAESVANVPAGQMAIIFGWSAFNMTVSCGGASGLEAVRQAAGFLLEDRATAAVAGGADELHVPLVRCLEPDAPEHGARAADTGTGHETVHSEGACLLLLERSAAARRRGVPVLATIEGSCSGLATAERGRSGSTVEAAIEEILCRLIRGAGRGLEDVDLVVSAAGTGRGDEAEAAAIHRVFGGRAAVLEPKRRLGEAWGASGPEAAVAAIQVLRAAGGNRRRAVVLSRCRRGHVAAMLIARGEAHAS